MPTQTLNVLEYLLQQRKRPGKNLQQPGIRYKLSFLSFIISNESNMIAQTPLPPYYAVIFSSIRTEGDNGYSEMADLMISLAKKQDGFLGVESARDQLGITVSYWRDPEAIRAWKEQADHQIAQRKGRDEWS